LTLVGVPAYRNNPVHVIRRIETDLALGRPVTLIRETGKPNWFQWRCGEKASHLTLADDRTCNIVSWPISLLELLPDSQSESYRITAQVRHDRSGTAGEVGVYFAHRAYAGGPSSFQFFTQLTFNAVLGEADFQAGLPDEFKSRRPPKGNVVWLRPHLLTEEGVQPHVDWRLNGASGPRFKIRGEENGHWYELELTVTPEGVAVRLDEQNFFVATRDIQKNLRADFGHYPPPKVGQLAPGSFPEFRGRGGLGLYVWRGSASFRSVTVTPL
jgi:serine/threonine-protein kinase